MKIRMWDEIGPLTAVEVTIYGPKNPDGSIQTNGFTFRIPDETVTKLKQMYQTNPQGLYDFIMKQVSEQNPITEITLGIAPNLDKDGKPIDPIDETQLDRKV